MHPPHPVVLEVSPEMNWYLKRSREQSEEESDPEPALMEAMKQEVPDMAVPMPTEEEFDPEPASMEAMEHEVPDVPVPKPSSRKKRKKLKLPASSDIAVVSDPYM